MMTAELLALLQGRDTPMLLKGYCRHWPLVQAGLASDAAALAYLQQFDGGQPVNLAVLAAETQGRVFYNADFSGFNYQAGKAGFSQLLQHLNTGATSRFTTVLYGVNRHAAFFSGSGDRQQFALASLVGVDQLMARSCRPGGSPCRFSA